MGRAGRANPAECLESFAARQVDLPFYISWNSRLAGSPFERYAMMDLNSKTCVRPHKMLQIKK